MKDKLIALLGLKPTAGQDEVTDDQVVFAVTQIQSQLLQHHGAAEYEKAINDVMIEGCGAFSRETAKDILPQRQREAAANTTR